MYWMIKPISSMWPSIMIVGWPPGFTVARLLPATSVVTSAANVDASSRQMRAAGASNPDGPGVSRRRMMNLICRSARGMGGDATVRGARTEARGLERGGDKGYVRWRYPLPAARYPYLATYATRTLRRDRPRRRRAVRLVRHRRRRAVRARPDVPREDGASDGDWYVARRSAAAGG